MHTLYMQMYSVGGSYIGPTEGEPGNARERAAACALATYHVKNGQPPMAEMEFGWAWDRLRVTE